MSFGILPIEDIKSCGVSADRHADQNVADVPSGDVNKMQTSAEPSDLISRADAIEVLCRSCGWRENGECAIQYSCKSFVGIKELPSTDTMSIEEHQQIVTELKQSYPSGDLVNRKTLIGAIEKCGEEKIYPQALIEVIKALPSADRQTDETCQDCPLYDSENHNCPRFNKVIPQTRAEMEADRPKGEWRWTHGGQCSECGFHNSNFDFNFCPICGADMRGDVM